MNIKSILSSLTIITVLSASATTVSAHNTSNTYDNNSVTQYTLNTRKNERYIAQLEDKVKRLEELLALADKFIERYLLSSDRPTRSYNNQRIEQQHRSTTVHACTMTVDKYNRTLIKIDTNQQDARNDLMQECRNQNIRQCSQQHISCASSQVNTNNR